MTKKEIVSFNPVVRDISSLVELEDEALDQVLGGRAIGDVSGCPTDNACEPNCRANCPNLA
ncbi:hypothetical protein [Vitiosangium sp. GDMCC 1.1324]|uniref:hypothetical protein n=1 Tax=Vitiosangium sp. (strain GDMCC 1.1324) TaxID=2138576 RepID=UPI0011B5CDDB|nr:hypothetical protein [Vitiosangium sp. GDMCC 1.1324]